MVRLHGWGRYPCVESLLIQPLSSREVMAQISSSNLLIARGLGRSYGDSSLAECVLETQYLNHLLAFDEQTGLLTCAAGVSLRDILQVFIPKGWFLPVTPGTQYVSVGGAVASDVHGKNHHHAGSFTQHVVALEIALGQGDIVTTSRLEHARLFHATCGGMGLTGVILSVQLKLKRIHTSQIIQRTLKIPHLESVLERLEEYHKASYSLAWLDCLAPPKNLGRSLLILGEHLETEGTLAAASQARKLSVRHMPMPTSFLNRVSNKVWNYLYYQKKGYGQQAKIISYEAFFYPLDAIKDWNYLYGQDGFVQYQFVLPKQAAGFGIKKILSALRAANVPVFLAVLKQFGAHNEHYLSFPMAGYTMALDLKADAKTFSLMKEWDAVVLDCGGRIYLAKDARMSESMFKMSYPQWMLFEEVRQEYGALGKFSSIQSRRLGLG